MYIYIYILCIYIYICIIINASDLEVQNMLSSSAIGTAEFAFCELHLITGCEQLPKRGLMMINEG